MAADEGAVYEVDERGFSGTVVIEGDAGARHVRISGTRGPDESAVTKDVPADRDPGLEALVGRCLAGEDGAPAALLAHLGVLDPN